MSLPCPNSLNSQGLTCFAVLFIPLLLGVVIAATKVPPIPVRGTGGPGELRPPAAVVGRAFAGIGAGARSNYEHMSDRAKLELILDSLLPNALKHSPGAGRFSSMPNRTNDQLVLDVAHTGPGIFMKERPAIFDALYSGSAPGARSCLWRPRSNGSRHSGAR